MYVPCIHAYGRESFTCKVRQAECLGLLVVPRGDDFDDNIYSRTMQKKPAVNLLHFRMSSSYARACAILKSMKTESLVYERASVKLKIGPKPDEGNM